MKWPITSDGCESAAGKRTSMKKASNQNSAGSSESFLAQQSPFSRSRAKGSSLSHRTAALLVGLLLSVMACNEGPTAPQQQVPFTPPTATPTPPPAVPQGLGEVYGVAREDQGLCLVGATIEILDGPLAGQRHQQSTGDCVPLSFRDGDEYIAFRFSGFPRDTPVSVQASMPGYASQVIRISSPAPFPEIGPYYTDWSGMTVFDLRKDGAAGH